MSFSLCVQNGVCSNFVVVNDDVGCMTCDTQCKGVEQRMDDTCGGVACSNVDTK